MTQKFPITQKFCVVVLSVVLSCLATGPSAFAGQGVAAQRVVSPAAHAATAASPLLAPATVCPGQTALDAPATAQEDAMRCMTAFARTASGLPQLAESDQLDGSAAAKAADVLSCDNFSHFACEREFTYWIEQSGYLGDGCWRAGENLAWGSGRYGTVRSIFRAWLASPGHRQNILGDFTAIGIALERGNLEGHRGTHLWAVHFGSHCEG